jgi:hypothetical protein
MGCGRQARAPPHGAAFRPGARGEDAEHPHAEKDAVLSLLSITFKETDTPSGDVLLTFSGGGTVRLTVECLECQMQDLGASMGGGQHSAHKLDDEQAP